MFRKFSVVLSLALISSLASICSATGASISIKNGSDCSKQGAVSVVIVKGLKKTYICTINPAAAMNPNIAIGGKKTWTLKTCVSYYAAYKENLKSINDQRDLVSIMKEPDKSTYTKQLDDSLAQLNKVVAAIETNHCKTGL